MFIHLKKKKNLSHPREGAPINGAAKEECLPAQSQPGPVCCLLNSHLIDWESRGLTSETFIRTQNRRGIRCSSVSSPKARIPAPLAFFRSLSHGNQNPASDAASWPCPQVSLLYLRSSLPYYSHLPAVYNAAEAPRALGDSKQAATLSMGAASVTWAPVCPFPSLGTRLALQEEIYLSSHRGCLFFF